MYFILIKVFGDVIEDRRPASGCDMYLVVNELLQTVFNRE